MMRRLSLRSRFVLLSLGSLVPLCLVVVVLLNLGASRNRDLQIANGESVANMTDRTISSFFDRSVTSMVGIAADPQVSALDPSAAILGLTPSLNPDFRSLFLVDSAGELVSPTTNPPTDIISGLGEQIPNTLTNRQVVISSRLKLADDTPIVVITVPVIMSSEALATKPASTTSNATPAAGDTSQNTTAPGQVVGALGGIIRLDQLDQQVMPLAEDDTDIAVIRQNGDLLLGTAGIGSDTRTFVSKNSVAIDLARSGRSNDFVAKSLDRGDVLGYYRPSMVEGNTWAIVVLEPGDHSYMSSLWIQGFLVLILAGLVILALAVVVGEIATRPLRALATKAEQMQQGDFRDRIEPVGSGEVLRLSTALSEMTNLVDGHTQDLEDDKHVSESQTRQMRDLLRRTLRLQENEQRRIASEIHDAVSPLITGALYQARALQMGNGSTPTEERAAALNQVNTLLERATQELHGVIFDLRPPDLDDLGVVAAIEAYVSTIQRTNVHVRLELGPEPPGLSPEVRLGMYRIVQEALHNLMRHSGADEALVRLESTADKLRLTIRDNGSGFDPYLAVRPTSLGLLSMRERAAAIGATLNIVSRPGGGTAIVLERERSDTVMSDDVLANLLSVDNDLNDPEYQLDSDDAQISAGNGHSLHNDDESPLGAEGASQQ